MGQVDLLLAVEDPEAGLPGPPRAVRSTATPHRRTGKGHTPANNNKEDLFKVNCTVWRIRMGLTPPPPPPSTDCWPTLKGAL